jgi:hypothetical protein
MECKKIEVEAITTKSYEIEEKPMKAYEFRYCISYRHPLLPERILARGYWNDAGIWLPEGKFED